MARRSNKSLGSPATVHRKKEGAAAERAVEYAQKSITAARAGDCARAVELYGEAKAQVGEASAHAGSQPVKQVGQSSRVLDAHMKASAALDAVGVCMRGGRFHGRKSR